MMVAMVTVFQDCQVTKVVSQVVSQNVEYRTQSFKVQNCLNSLYSH